MTTIVASSFIRGEVITDNLISVGGRGGEIEFLVPDPMAIVKRLPLKDPTELSDLYTLTFDEIVDYLAQLGDRLALSKNDFMQEALEHSYAMTDMTPSLLRRMYAELPLMFSADTVREAAEVSVGIRFLDGWGKVASRDGRNAQVRAMGARTLHIVPGNAPGGSALAIIRNAITRGDAIVKAPSNDPLTALAIARTMARMAPDHPVTRHLAVAYWKGGNEAFEELLYQPRHIEKIVAWGGFASMKHVTRYIQPGLELISFDPKRSATIIGREAFADDQTMKVVALRAATDVGAFNQLGCVSARVIFVATGTDDDGLQSANRFGQMVYDAVLSLPDNLSTNAQRFNPELRANLQALKSSPDFYRVIGGKADEGAIIVSQFDQPVDFYPSLSDRVANVVPIDRPLDVLRHMNAYTQTVGVYPDTLKAELRDVLPLHGVQRLVSLGYAAHINTSLPQDAFEPLRRMVKWIVDDSCDPDMITPLWAG